MRPAIKILSSLALSCTLLVLLGLLTWLGTLEQVEYGLFEVQKKYFESLFLCARRRRLRRSRCRARGSCWGCCS